MIEPRGRLRRGCTGGVAGAGVLVGAAATGVAAAGVLSCAKTARAASRAACVWAGAGARRGAVVGLVPELERAWKTDEFGVICMMIKFYTNAPKIPLIADSPHKRLWNKPLQAGVYAVPLIWCGPADPGRACQETMPGQKSTSGGPHCRGRG